MREKGSFYALGFVNLPKASSTLHQSELIRLLRYHIHSKSLIHAHLFHDYSIRCGHDTYSLICCLLLQFYFKCGAFNDVVRLFDITRPYRDNNILSWNLVIGSCVRQGEYLDAFRYFDEMQCGGIAYDKFTFIQVLSACTTLEEGLLVYDRIQGSGLEFDTIVGTATVTMFGINGDVHNAERAFDDILVRNVVSWNALLSVYVQNKQFSKAISLFDRIYEEGISPDKVSFVIF